MIYFSLPVYVYDDAGANPDAIFSKISWIIFLKLKKDLLKKYLFGNLDN
jgi:hypothetical protein